MRRRRSAKRESGRPLVLELLVLIVAFIIFRSFFNSSNLFSDY